MIEMQNSAEDGILFKEFVGLKLTAGKAFYNWAEVLSGQIEEIGKLDSLRNHEKSEFHLVSSYLTDTELNRSKRSVPKSLKMVTIALLGELTIHIKDHHSKTKLAKNQTFLTLPKNRKVKAVPSSSSSSPRLLQDDSVDESCVSMARTPQLSRDSEMNRSRGKLGLGGVSAVRNMFNRWTSKDKEYPDHRESHHEGDEMRAKKSSFRTQSMTKHDAQNEITRLNRNISWINNVAKCLAEEDFSCSHINGCSFHCTKHLQKSCQSLADGIKLVIQNIELDTYEVPVFDRETFDFLSSYDLKRIETILEELYLVPLQFLADNIYDISDETLKLLIQPCWNLLSFHSTRIGQQAAVIIILAAQKFQGEMEQLLEMKLVQSKVPPVAFHTLWRTRNIIWNLVDRRIAKQYRLPSLAVNISLPNPPIGDQIPQVPDAPWQPNIQDVDLLLAEEIGTQSIHAASARKKDEQLLQIIERDSNRREFERKEFLFTGIPVIQSILTSYHKNLDSHDDYDEEQRRFSSRLMSMSSSATGGDETHEISHISDLEGSPDKTIHSGREGIPSQVFPLPLQNIIAKFISVADNHAMDV